ncbi:MAG: hypothetical protein NXY57DRAFT_995571 [Lentinula lateritia]|nr:MAG: hypothetical protein NXY57DRAFT_995571 [Lentinula lateritia]
MENRGNNERRTPRRLFSFDSVKSSSTRRSSSDTPSNIERKASKGSLHTIASEQSEGNGNWTLPDITESPRSVTPRPTTPFSERDKRKGPRPPLPPVVVDTTARSVTPDGLPPSSPSSIRWNSLRQHVLPPSKSTHSQQSSSASLTSISAQAASRTGHAKQSSKFAQRLGFRNVVDQVKQVMVDEIQQFTHDIQRACMAAYHIELPPSVKSRIDPLHIPVGSTLSLPFISGTNLTVGGITGSANPSRSDLRQPSVSSSIAAGRVRPLYQTLINYAGPFADGSSPLPQLPLESLVISTLLVPFLTTDSASATEEDRWLSIEAFQIVIKTWTPTTELVAVERSMWCVQAALSSPPPLRTRILSILWSITVPEESHYPASNTKVLQTLLHGLFLLLPWISTQGADTEDSKLLSEIISEVCAGSCDQLDDLHVEEEYNALFVDADTPQRIRDAVITEALARCLEFSPDSTRRWLFKNSVENLWSFPEEPFFTPLLTAIHSRALLSFTRALLALLSSTTHDAKSLRNDAHLVVQALQSRVFPELTYITSHTAEDAKRNVVSIAFSLVSLEVKELVDWSISTMVEWYRQLPEWKDCFAKSFESLILESPWINLLKLLPPLMRSLPDDVRKPLSVILLFALNERLVDEPPPYPCLPLSSLLDSLSQSYPQIFYKPLFQCAASTREHVVVKHLCTLTALARFMPDFWIKDAEMMSIATMGDMGMKSPGSGITQGIPGAVEPWGTARLGQSVLIVELIAQVQSMRRVRENSTNSASDTAFIAMAKFAISLEQRLSILIETKEHTSLIPLSQRLLFCMLFREIRLLTRSLKSAPWLPRFVEWFVSYNEHTDDDSDVVALRTTTQIKALYALAQTGGRPSNTRRSTAILSPTPTSGTFVDENVKNIGLAAIFAQRTPILEAMYKGFEARALKLLVAMSSLIHLDDYRRIGTILWQQHLEDNDPRTLSSICFLVMQCAEKNPHDLLANIEIDLQSTSDDTRLAAIRKVSTLANSRFQIMSQHVIADRAHRPFKVARPPLPFVTTDIGSGTFVLELDPSEVQDKLPLELRKKLAEIGWEDGGSPVNQQLEWIRTPMSNLPPLQVEKLDSSGNVPPSPNLSPVSSPSRSPILGEKAEELGLLRRNSTSGGPLSGFKRRAIFVPSLLQILPRIAAMTCDRSPVVAHAARTMILDLMRNDPGLLTRPVWDFLTGEGQDLPTAVTTLRAFLHSRRLLPPLMAHVMLNTLAGFLKDLAKHTENAHTLQYFAQTVPIIAKLVPQVYEMSVRDLRRNKVDVFLIPSGSLWFSSPAPPGPMFPRGPGVLDNPFDDCTTRIVSITLIRISQNMLFFAMLKRNPSEVQAVRKSMTKLVFPSLTGAEEPALQLRDLVPSKKPSVPASSAIDVEIRGLSLTLSRSFILLVAQIFRCLSRHLNDRAELSILVESLNRILLAHGNDVGIVAQTLIALLVASTRFRRLFASGGGYTLFMPVLFKVYAESEAHHGIRCAIEYAVNRFYAYHEETFVFQSLDAIAHVLVLPDIDRTWIVRSIYTLFATLRRNTSSNEPDMAGIHHANKDEEREALMVLTAEEKPQAFFASLRNSGGQSQSQTIKSSIAVELPVEYESKRLEMSNFIRLFLTVIAHDLSIARAEQFLKLFRYLVPSLYETSVSARTVLKDGLVALGAILLRPTLSKARAAEYSRQNDARFEKSYPSEMHLADLSKLPSDMASMRMDYLWSLVSFAEIGGELHPDTVRTAFDLVKTILRESPTPTLYESVASFLAAFSKRSMEGGRRLKTIVHFLRDLAPILNEHAHEIDFTEVFDTISQLSKNPMYFNDSIFCNLVVNQICAAGLRACDAAASEDSLQSLPGRRSLISLIKNAILLPGADIFSQIEESRASYDFLALVILPLALTMKTLNEMNSDGAQRDPVQRALQARAWSRLLLYVISCCRKTQGKGSPNLERSKSQDKHNSAIGYGTHLPSLLVALQVIKVIVIRAGEDLNHSLPDMWLRLAVFLRQVLGDGNAEFSLHSDENSPNPSPTPSPRSSGQFNIPFLRPNTANFNVSRGFMSPRIVDYCLWSFLELLCVYRNPLFIQLRAFVHEKVRILDQELRYQQDSHTPISSRARRPSSVFTRSRRRTSNISASNSPEASPRLTSLATPELSFSGNFSLYQNLPAPSAPSYSPLRESSSPSAPRPRIVHLGLVSNTNTFRRSLSPGGTSAMRHMVKSTKVKSLILVRKTYLRIRVVQTCMGYQSELLPLPQTSIDSASGMDDIPVATPWTKRRALHEVVNETRELLVEFDETNELESEGVLIQDIDSLQ